LFFLLAELFLSSLSTPVMLPLVTPFLSFLALPFTALARLLAVTAHTAEAHAFTAKGCPVPRHQRNACGSKQQTAKEQHKLGVLALIGDEKDRQQDHADHEEEFTDLELESSHRLIIYKSGPDWQSDPCHI
jgi:hypothetical protein